MAAWLLAEGWTLVARNVRVGRDEIDLVALEPGEPGTLTFVEVRSRTSPTGSRWPSLRGPGCGAPEESVDARKVGRLYRSALAIVRSGHLPDGEPLPGATWRVDLVTVVRDGAAGPWRVRAHLRGLSPP